MHQVPIIPPLDLVITTVEEHGRPSAFVSGQLEIAQGLLGSVMSSPPSPGCWSSVTVHGDGLVQRVRERSSRCPS